MKVPKLRFKEFNDEYKENKLEDYLIQYKEVTTENNQYPVLTSSRQGIFFQEDYFNRQVASKDNTGYNIVPRGYFTYRHMSDDTVFSFNINDICDYGIVSTLYPVFTTNSNMNSVYLKNYLNYGKKFSDYCLLQKQGGSRTYMYFEKLKKFNGFFPNITEQEKVSKFIELLNKKIELQSKKIEDLKLFKKGLIDTLINNITDYKTVELGKIGNTYSGLTGKTKEDFENGNCKFIPFTSVLNNKINIDSLPTVLINNNESQNMVEERDLFFNTSSETKDEVALCTTLNEKIDNLYLNSFCFGFRIKDLNIVDNNYLNILLHSTNYRKKISVLGQGFTRINISKNKLMELNISIPNMVEQLKISKMISLEENKIKYEIDKLDKLNELKKGLMQNLFV